MTPRHKRSRWQTLLRRIIGAHQPPQQQPDTITRVRHNQEIQALHDWYNSRETELGNRIGGLIAQNGRLYAENNALRTGLIEAGCELQQLRAEKASAWAARANTNRVSAPAPADDPQSAWHHKKDHKPPPPTGSEDPTVTVPAPAPQWDTEPRTGAA